MHKTDDFPFAKIIVAFFSIGLLIYAAGFIFVLKGLIEGNFWFTKQGVLQELKIDHPQITEVIKITRNVFGQSIFMVKENEQRHYYCLDTDVLFNYIFTECKGE